MSSSNVDIPPDRSIVAVNNLAGPNKVLFLPAASTVPGRFITIKDYYGNSGSSSFTVSTTSNNRIDRFNSSIVISTSFQCLTLLSDGISNWATVANENGPIPLTFLPSDIATPGIWFDAAFLPNITFDSANCNVTSWSNRGSKVVAAGSNASQPPPKLFQQRLNSLNVMSYSASNILIIPAMTVAYGDKTVFAVCKQNSIWTASSARAIPFIVGQTGYNFGDFVFTMGYDGANGSNFVGTVNGGYCFPTFANIAQTSNIYTILSGVNTIVNDGRVGMWQNGSLLNSNFLCPAENNGASMQFSIGGGTQDRNASHELAEVILYESALTVAERQRIEGYLAWKWGLRNLLPADHPYKNASP